MTSTQATRRKRRTQSAPTVADVVPAAGVSLMTVSRVINAEPNVLEATRAKVRAAVAVSVAHRLGLEVPRA